MLCWIDTETTGLDPETCALLEVALVVTTNDLEEVAAKAWVLPFNAADAADYPHPISDFVQKMHAKNGLWQECATVCPAEHCPGHRRAVEAEILAMLRRHTSAKEGPICGSTVAFDRRFLEVHMPSVAAHFSHRNLDASVFTEISRLWAPAVYEARPKMDGHRALPDIRGSIALMRYWREHLPEVLDTKADVLVKLAEVERERGHYYSTMRTLEAENEKLRAANATATERATDLQLKVDALEAEVARLKKGGAR